LRHVRASLAEVLINQRIPADRALDSLPDKVSAVATELAGNAMHHGIPPAQVCVFRCDAAFLLEVTDGATQRPPQLVTDLRTPTFGLRIVTHLADDTGWYVNEVGKHVWAQFTMPDWRTATE
jgi:serine/threonine-protein kinase RsbW